MLAKTQSEPLADLFRNRSHNLGRSPVASWFSHQPMQLTARVHLPGVVLMRQVELNSPYHSHFGESWILDVKVTDEALLQAIEQEGFRQILVRRQAFAYDQPRGYRFELAKEQACDFPSSTMALFLEAVLGHDALTATLLAGELAEVMEPVDEAARSYLEALTMPRWRKAPSVSRWRCYRLHRKMSQWEKA